MQEPEAIGDESLALDELMDLKGVDSGLSKWAVEFIDSVSLMAENEGILTARQIEKIHELWDQHCA